MRIHIVIMMVFPTELYIQIAHYLEPPDLKSYSLVSKQIRTCALEYMVFNARDSETIKNAMDAGARHLRLIYLTNDTLLELDSTILNKVVELTRAIANLVIRFANPVLRQ